MNRKNYLVIEDDYSERMLLKELLSINFINVIEAVNTVDGLLKAETHKDNLDAIMISIDSRAEESSFPLKLVKDLSDKYNIPIIAVYSRGINSEIKSYLEHLKIKTLEKPLLLKNIKPIIVI